MEINDFLKDVVIISHAEDPDGIMSASILMHLLEIKECRIFPIAYATQNEDMRAIAQSPFVKLSRVYVLDLNASNHLFTALNNQETPTAVLLVQNALSVTWIDHHEGTAEKEGFLTEMGARVIVKTRECTTAIVNKTFNVTYDSYSIRLSRIAEASDYRNRGSEGDRQVGIDAQKIISLHNYNGDKESLVSLIWYFASYNQWLGASSINHPPLKQQIKEYDERHEALRQELEHSLTTVTVGRHKFLVGFANALIYSKDTVRGVMPSDRDIDAVLVFFGAPSNNCLFFKHPDGEFNCTNFCISMGGGGRDGSGGYGPRKVVTKGTFQSALRNFQEDMGTFLEVETSK